MLHCGLVRGVARGCGGEVNKERPERRRAKIAFGYPKASAQNCPGCGLDMGEKEEAPAGLKSPAGVTRTGRTARYSPSPQPSGLRHPQAGFAGARPSGKVENSNGSRY